MKINNSNELKGLDDFNLRGAYSICDDCQPEKCDDQDCDFYLDFHGVQIDCEISLQEQLKQAKGKAKRKIRRQLKKSKINGGAQA